MLTPEEISEAAESLTPIFRQLEQFVIDKMAVTFKDMIISDEVKELKEIAKSAKAIGMLFDEIQQGLYNTQMLSKQQISIALATAGIKNIDAEKKILEHAGLEIKADSFPYLKQIIMEAIEQTSGEIENITQTKAVGFYYETSFGRFYEPFQNYFMQQLDASTMGVRSGLMTTEQAVKQFIQSTALSGMVLEYASGYRCDAEVAARRAIRTGVSQMAQKQNTHIADENDMPYAEVTAHQGARPTHKEWQGRIYRREGSEPEYPNLYDVTGLGTVDGLLGVNCRHQWHGWDKGLPKTYTNHQLENIDPPPFEFDGKEITFYEATQKMRSYERAVRRGNLERSAAEAVGDAELMEKAESRIAKAYEKAKELNKISGIKMRH